MESHHHILLRIEVQKELELIPLELAVYSNLTLSSEKTIFR